MNSKNKSAKDIAFEKERLRIRKEAQKEILEAKRLLIQARVERDAALERAYAAESKNTELEEWIERLLEYTNLSRADMMAIGTAADVQKENAERMADILAGLQQMNKMFGFYRPVV